MKRLLGTVLAVFLISTPAAAQSWQQTSINDQLHNRSGVALILAGKFLSPPMYVPQGLVPTLVVKCWRGKVVENYFDFGAVLQARRDSVFPVTIESNLDGKMGTIGADALSQDGTWAFFSRLDLKKVLHAKKVIVGADEYLGREITAEFDIPGPEAVLAVCGKDRILR